MTGYAEFPDMTGPRPLLLPATATKTVGTPSPEGRKLCYHNKSSFFLFILNGRNGNQPSEINKYTPSYSPLMRSVSSGPLCAEVTLRKQGIPKEEHAFLIFSQWAVSEVEPIRTTTLPPAGASSSS